MAEPLLLLLVAPFALFPTPARFVLLLAIPAVWFGHWLFSRNRPAANNPPPTPGTGSQSPTSGRPLRAPASLFGSRQPTGSPRPPAAFRQLPSAFFIPRTPLDWPILLLAVMVLVSLYATFDIAFSLPKIAGMVFGIAVFYALVRAGERPAGWWWGLAAFLGAGAGMAALGLVGARWTAKVAALQPFVDLLPRSGLSLAGAEQGIHPNELAGSLLWVIPALIAAAWLLVSRARALRARLGSIGWTLLLAAALAANVLVLGAFVLTQSRSAYAGLGLALPALALLGVRGRARWILAAVFLLAAGLGLYFILGSESTSVDSFGADPALQLETLNGRVEIWSRALYGLQDFPFTGMGMNTFRRVVHVLYPLFLVGPDVDIAHAHNEFLQAGLDLGLPGLIAFAALYLGAFWMLIEAWRKAGQGSILPYKTMALGLGGGLMAHLVFGLTDAVALGAKPGVLFWMLLGLIAGLYRQAQSSPIAAAQPAAESIRLSEANPFAKRPVDAKRIDE